jgi:hypothetical protein
MPYSTMEKAIKSGGGHARKAILDAGRLSEYRPATLDSFE